MSIDKLKKAFLMVAAAVAVGLPGTGSAERIKDIAAVAGVLGEHLVLVTHRADATARRPDDGDRLACQGARMIRGAAQGAKVFGTVNERDDLVGGEVFERAEVSERLHGPRTVAGCRGSTPRGAARSNTERSPTRSHVDPTPGSRRAHSCQGMPGDTGGRPRVGAMLSRRVHANDLVIRCGAP